MCSSKLSKLNDILSSFNLEKLAKETSFSVRNSGKIDATNFLLSFYQLLICRSYSLRLWATALSSLIDDTVSFQAISKKLSIRHVMFAKQLLQMSISYSLKKNFCSFDSLPFNRILIEDSTCISLPDSLYDAFPGSSNQNIKNKAIARIQLRVDIQSDSYENIALQSYKEHDAKFADNILDNIKPNDLSIRDLGYFKTSTLVGIEKEGAFYVSRIKPIISIYNIDNEEIKLHKYLKEREVKGISKVDCEMKIGKTKHKVRLVCFKLSQPQIKKRLRKSKRNGNRNKNLSKKTLYLYTWNIFVTNIEPDVLDADHIYQLYRLRWHIELIFKNWKSNLKINEIMKSCQGRNGIKPEMLLYLSLSFITLIAIPHFNKYKQLVYEKYKKLLSQDKFMKTFLNNIDFLLGPQLDKILKLLEKNCCYDKRKDQSHLFEIFIFKKLG